MTDELRVGDETLSKERMREAIRGTGRKTIGKMLRCDVCNQYAPDRCTCPKADPAAQQVDPLLRCLDFFASVIKSGERWTDTCQRMYDLARELDGIARKHASGVAAEPAVGSMLTEKQFFDAWDEWNPNGSASFDDFQAGWLKAQRAATPDSGAREGAGA